ncbi:protein translocase subunit SecD [Falcatimonas sp. MSJ-15]|uniref:protein translocase subunit SecD n=1 Tax=Falcatimonas sp. MSJ-15 TaxID=2841515 RepID=UPI001C0FABA0|nr:protein translocase subunit SecD [Falcatimonas sp. MSJ-15]MBU5468780.1 protein translocase subunit SecD [Falcatimonas sp. MSJ-15]
MSKKGKKILELVLFAAVLIFFGFTALIGLGPTKTGSASNIKLGLDLEGGVSISYEAVGDVTSSEMADTVYKLQKRVDNYSTEAVVYKEGDSRINVEIPGIQDANAILEELGKPGSIAFYDPDNNLVVDGNSIKSADAQQYKDQSTGATKYAVSLVLTDEGAEKFAEVTSKLAESYSSTGTVQRISIVYDDQVISSPQCTKAITGGDVMIDNMESYDSAKNLASTIRIGCLPVELEEVSSKVVGATLGQDAVNTSIKAGIIGFALVVAFMCAVYLVPGVVASIALLFYTILTVLILNAFDITLTLPGIAGIVLTIGMAVDANVIIFARIREEIASGKTVRTSITNGFGKAFWAIFDGNITTLIAAVVLYLKGSGTVKGFAQTLAIGIVLSMFTALVISKFVLNAFYELGFKDAKFYGKAKEAKSIDFLSKKNIFFGVSLAVIIIGFVVMGINGSKDKGILNYGLDFKGGTSLTVTFNEEYTQEQIGTELIPVIQEVIGTSEPVQQQKVDESNGVVFKTRTLTLEEREKVYSAFEEKYGVDETAITSENISATVSNEMKSDAIVAVIIATICMLLYIWFRFKDIKFATSAVVALLHDVFVVLAFYAIARVSVGNTFIACMLTIVGYSINATIVIFDRIRENLKGNTKPEQRKDLVNTSISQTLSRSINTSLTTFIMVAVLYILGVTSIREFALPLMVGIVCGAYSSVCITGALWYTMSAISDKRKAKAAK